MRISYTEGELLTKDDIGLVFKDRIGRQWKIECFSELYKLLVVINKDRNDWNNLTEYGKEDDKFDEDCDFVSLVGFDFTEDKELRKFEFEAEIVENKSMPPQSFLGKILGHILGHDACGFYKIGSFTKENLSEGVELSKWKLTMEELPND